MSSFEDESESQHDHEDPTSKASTKKRKKWSRGKLIIPQKGAKQFSRAMEVRGCGIC
jgi:hypothetical protein